MGWQNAWVTEKKKEGSWKDVRAYDSSDLEQWVEQSLPGQAWFANETGSPTQSVRSLDKCWTDWANVATPPLPGSLFSSAIEDAKRKLASRLAKGPKDQSWSQRTPPTKRWPLLPSALAPKEVPNWNLIGTRSWFSIKLVSYRNLQAGRGRSFQ